MNESDADCQTRPGLMVVLWHLVQKGVQMIGKPMQAIEFLGGPVDGHVDLFQVAAKSFVLVESATRTPSGRWALLIRRLLFRDHSQRATVAVYELQSDGARYVYRYLRSMLATEAKFDAQRAEHMVHPADSSPQPTIAQLRRGS